MHDANRMPKTIMPCHYNDIELAEGIEDLSLIIKEMLAAKFEHVKSRYRILEKEFGELDNDKRSLEAEANVLEKKVHQLQG